MTSWTNESGTDAPEDIQIFSIFSKNIFGISSGESIKIVGIFFLSPKSASFTELLEFLLHTIIRASTIVTNSFTASCRFVVA
jgi:hypothetical protein